MWTIIIGVTIGISANLLTPKISMLMSKYSISYKNNRVKKQKTIENTIQYLIDNPHDETNLRIEKNGRILRAFILMVGGLTIALLDTNRNLTYTSIVFVFFSIVFMIQARKYNYLVGMAWKKRKEQHNNIDLD